MESPSRAVASIAGATQINIRLCFSVCLEKGLVKFGIGEHRNKGKKFSEVFVFLIL